MYEFALILADLNKPDTQHTEATMQYNYSFTIHENLIKKSNPKRLGGRIDAPSQLTAKDSPDGRLYCSGTSECCGSPGTFLVRIGAELQDSEVIGTGAQWRAASGPGQGPGAPVASHERSLVQAHAKTA
nr:hypothetical protein [Siccirubricoccus deserti]